MAPQNEQAAQILTMLFEYIALLKQDNARISSESASKDEVITQKQNEADEFKLMYETYLNNDNSEDGALAALIDKAKADLEALKAA